MFNALLKAIKKNNVDKVRQLIDQGVDIEKRFDNDRTVLLLAIEKRKYEIARCLLDAGANVNAIDEDGASAIYNAVRSGDAVLLKELVAFGADINIESGSWTLLHFASAHGDPHMIGELLSLGLDASKVDDNGKTAIEYARSDRKDEIIAVIEAHRQNQALLQTVDDGINYNKDIAIKF